MSERTWLITGVSSGFGRHISELLLQRGDRVVGTVRKPESVADLVEQYPERFRMELLDAINEGTIGAIFENVRQCVQFEVDSDDPEICEGIDMKVWRRLLLAAVNTYEPASSAHHLLLSLS